METFGKPSEYDLLDEDEEDEDFESELEVEEDDGEDEDSGTSESVSEVETKETMDEPSTFSLRSRTIAKNIDESDERETKRRNVGEIDRREEEVDEGEGEAEGEVEGGDGEGEAETEGGEGEDNEFDEQTQERLLTWRKNVPFLYDICLTYQLDTPSLTVDWSSLVQTVAERGYEESTLFFGTQINENEKKEPNNVMLARCRFPVPQDTDDIVMPGEKREIPGRSGIAQDKKLHIKMKLIHKGDVNRIRSLPTNPMIFCTRSSTNETYLFDYTKHSSFPTNELFIPELCFEGHEAEGYGLSWNRFTPSVLSTCADDGMVLLWDVNEKSKRGEFKTSKTDERPVEIVQPISKYLILHDGKKIAIEDVIWHSLHEKIMFAVDDIGRIICIDVRQFSPVISLDAHNRISTNTINISDFSEFLLATGTSDSKNSVSLFDIRFLGKHFAKLPHNGSTYSVHFSPHHEGVLATSGEDGYVRVWDLKKMNCENVDEPNDSALLFLHCGHTGTVTEVCWHPNSMWTLSSVDSDGALQIWQIAESLL